MTADHSPLSAHWAQRRADDDDDLGPPCPKCGGEMDWEECEECDGEGGWYPHELSPIEYPDPDELSPCQICDGVGGWWRCGNCREWCPVHSMPK